MCLQHFCCPMSRFGCVLVYWYCPMQLYCTHVYLRDFNFTNTIH